MRQQLWDLACELAFHDAAEVSGVWEEVVLSIVHRLPISISLQIAARRLLTEVERRRRRGHVRIERFSPWILRSVCLCPVKAHGRIST